MAGFDDLIPACMPYAATETISGTAGSDWEWEYLAVDNAGDPVDFTGCTGACRIVGFGGFLPPIISFPEPGVIRCTSPSAETAGYTPGRCSLSVEITDASSRTITIVGGGDSCFTILPGA